MAATDFIFALTSKNSSNKNCFEVLPTTNLFVSHLALPYIINYLIGWNGSGEFNYNGELVILLSLPLTIHYKVNLCVATAIAIDRLQVMSHKRFQKSFFILLQMNVISRERDFCQSRSKNPGFARESRENPGFAL